MSNQSEDIQAANSDTRPSMLDMTDFESWKQRIRLYCKGKIMESTYFSLLMKAHSRWDGANMRLLQVLMVLISAQSETEWLQIFHKLKRIDLDRTSTLLKRSCLDAWSASFDHL
ncbi:hypothetical protein Tco_0183357 [Tanacetum coccineum]